MPFESEMKHPRSLSFAQQRRVMDLRDREGLSWEKIAERVVNREGEHPSWKQCSDIWKRFNTRKGRVQYKYWKCGRKKTMKAEDVQWVVRQLLRLRKKGPCTSPMLQRLLAKQRNVVVEASLIRKRLREHGYRWLARSRKIKYTTEEMIRRKAWADSVLKLPDAALRKRLSMAMDGVILAAPPTDLTKRLNYCRQSEPFCWRKPDEAMEVDLAGGDQYRKQVPASRAVPLWGGCSAGGFAVVVWHARKKLSVDDWVAAVKGGKLREAVLSLRPTGKRPWSVIADNESFLRAAESKKAYGRDIRLWDIPPRSPDLNPVEQFWSWLRKTLVAMDLKDLNEGRDALDKAAFRLRVQRLLKTQRAQRVASNCALNLRKVCQLVSASGGAACT